ncbi:MAG: Gfo/Idh/MocA family oxidoreductase [Mycobacterium sp.]|nr:Gfo/Idh/MocA family oxidoreductase [Mycobacterium sp.]
MAGLSHDPVRWAILSTAGIAHRTFLPSLAAVGRGVATVVAGRDQSRTERFAAENGVERAVVGYERALDDPEVDAVYIPLPNSMHAEWTIAALEAGKVVLCEKPLCFSAAQTRDVLAAATKSGKPLWEAIAFLFRSQTDRLLELIAEGAIGEVREIQSAFHFTIEPGDIRLDPDLAGGALADGGCYPIRLARLIFDAEATGVRASSRLTDDGVDLETWGIVDFPGDRRLLFSSSFTKAYDTTTRILGTDGELRVSRVFAGLPVDTIEWRKTDDSVVVEHAVGDDPQFAGVIGHIHEVLLDGVPPRHLAVDDALGSAAIIDAIRRSAATAPEPVS